MRVQSLGWEDTLAKEKATHSSGESPGQRSLVGTVPWGCKKSGMNKASTLYKIKHTLIIYNQTFSSVQLLRRVRLFETPHRLQHTRLPVHPQLTELTQTHAHLVGDATQPSYPLSSPSPGFNLSQHQGLFK